MNPPSGPAHGAPPPSADEDCLPTRRSLLSRLRDLDDTASWQVFFDRYWRLIFNVARRNGLSEQAAEDVVQETVIAVARRMPEFRYDPAEGSFKQWLLLITRRRIQDHWRRLYRQGRPADLPPEEWSRQAESLPAPAPTPEDELTAAWEAEWRGNLLRVALARLRQKVNPKHYQVFDSCVLQNLRAPEVARMLGLNVAQVYLIKHRMSRLVRRAVEELESELGRTNP